MKEYIGYCGLDCKSCDAYIATIHDDQSLREKTAKLWSALNNAPILPEHINCEGCRMEGKKTVFCESLCVIRKCAVEKGVVTCKDCEQFSGCSNLEAVFLNTPSAKENLIELDTVGK